jgi:hypothetical protein
MKTKTKKVEKRECAVCSKKFTPKTANAKTCSQKCHKARKAELDKARRANTKKAKVAEKPAIKGKSVEKINLAPEKKCLKKCENKVVKTSVAISGDAFEVIATSLFIMLNTLRQLVEKGSIRPL